MTYLLIKWDSTCQWPSILYCLWNPTCSLDGQWLWISHPRLKSSQQKYCVVFTYNSQTNCLIVLMIILNFSFIKWDNCTRMPFQGNQTSRAHSSEKLVKNSTHQSMLIIHSAGILSGSAAFQIWTPLILFTIFELRTGCHSENSRDPGTSRLSPFSKLDSNGEKWDTQVWTVMTWERSALVCRDEETIDHNL